MGTSKKVSHDVYDVPPQGDENGRNGAHVEPERESDGLIERGIEYEGVDPGNDALGAYRQPLDKPLEKPK